MPELKRIFIIDVGGPHTYRTIYLDGRSIRRISLPAITVTPSAIGKGTRSSSILAASMRDSGLTAADCLIPSSFT